MDIEKFDYVVVGAGAAGCIVASRLSEDGRNRVLLLEAGPRDTALGLKMPAAFGVAKMMLPFKWGFETEPEPGLVNRRLPLRMGRVIGGSSSVNGMCYHRGHPGIYDHWENLGCSGWGYSDVLPYFLKAETNHARQDEFHGQEGPMHITAGDDSESGFSNELDEAFINSGLAMGLQRTYDFDGSVPEGIGYEDRTIYKGVRMSTSRAYLSEAGKRSNLTVRPDSTVIRLTGESDKLSSVEYEYKGKKKVAAAEKEIVLCAGALMTPHILMHSGVGHADVLEKYGISVKKELSGVGQNLQNHPDVVCSFAINKPVSSNRFTHGLGSIVAGLQWLLFKRGPVASNHFVASAFIRTKPDIEFPDIKLTFLPCCLKDSGEILCKHGFQIDISLTQPTSPGTVQIGSADPKVPPKIALNYLTEAKDMNAMVAAVSFVRQLVFQGELEQYGTSEMSPGASMVDADSIEDWIRNSTNTTHHGVGTAKMGLESAHDTVVDCRGRLKGFPNIRIADTSIMPHIVTGGTYGPVIMIAEKISDHILNLRQAL